MVRVPRRCRAFRAEIDNVSHAHVKSVKRPMVKNINGARRNGKRIRTWSWFGKHRLLHATTGRTLSHHHAQRRDVMVCSRIRPGRSIHAKKQLRHCGVSASFCEELIAARYYRRPAPVRQCCLRTTFCRGFCTKSPTKTQIEQVSQSLLFASKYTTNISNCCVAECDVELPDWVT